MVISSPCLTGIRTGDQRSASSSLFGSSTFVELIRGDVESLFGEVLGEGSSRSMVVEEDALAVSGGGRVAMEIVIDTTLGGLKYSSNIG
ncbi:hypothetical protein Tco_0128450 [Tanacetum coccineum]